MSFHNFVADNFQLYLYFAIALVFIIQLIYFWGIFPAFSLAGNKPTAAQQQPVSIIICARNEYYNLEANLSIILKQDYPNFEVICVNDRSDDDTNYLLNDLARQYPRLKVLHIQENKNFFQGKKFPLSLGIKSAKNEIILLTDADCHPANPLWISQMQAQFSNPKTQIVLGYGGYATQKGLLNKLIRFDTLMIALQYFSLARIGIPYMGVGRNLAYRKSFFLDKKGFVSHYKVSSGDDDLFVNANATRKNTRCEFSHPSHTISEPKTNFSSWIFQKKRHATTGQYYKFKHKFLLSLFPFTTLLLYGLAATIIALYPTLYTIITLATLLIIRVASQLIITKNAMMRLKEKDFLLFSPFFELFFIIFNLYVMLSNLTKQQREWK
ncbi:MAG: glycosyltransferase [Bacteroidota bacterium]